MKKTRLLLVYGYILPVLASVLTSMFFLPLNIGIYKNISIFFSNNIEIILAFLALMTAITIPFQNNIFTEENPHVLAVLEKSKTRNVFLNSSILQATIIILFSFSLLILSSIGIHTEIIGLFEIFAFSLISFESLALISNGCSYRKIREQIIFETNQVILKSEKKNPKD